MKTNYHTHTSRCHHARGEDRDYVEAAIRGGYQVLGFADHGPFPFKNGYVSKGTRMTVGELDGYLASIRSLKQEYAGQIEILTGLEYEAFPAYMDWLADMAEEKQLDYMILGNHFELDEENALKFAFTETPAQMRSYLDQTIRGMESGLFAYLCHPELYMYNYRVWDDEAKAVSRAICQAAKQYDMPLEYNLYGVYKIAKGVCPGPGYPYPLFWEMAAREGCRVILGMDAHDPFRLESKDHEIALRFLNSLGIEITDTIPLRGQKA